MEHFDDEVSKKFSGLESSLPPGGWQRMQRALWWDRWKATIMISTAALLGLMSGYLYWSQLVRPSAFNSITFVVEPHTGYHYTSGKNPSALQLGTVPSLLVPSHDISVYDNAPISKSSQAPTQKSFIDHSAGTSDKIDGGLHPSDNKVHPAQGDWVKPTNETPIKGDVSYALSSVASLSMKPEGENLKEARPRPFQPRALSQNMASPRFLEFSVSSRVACKSIRPSQQKMLWQLENGDQFYAQRWGYELGISMGGAMGSKRTGNSRSTWNLGISVLNINESVAYTVFEPKAEVIATGMQSDMRMSISSNPASNPSHMKAQLYYVNIQAGGEHYFGQKGNKFIGGGVGIGKLLEPISTVVPQEHFTATDINPFGYLAVGKAFEAPGSLGRAYQLKLSASARYYPNSFTGAFDVNTTTFGLDLAIRKFR